MGGIGSKLPARTAARASRVCGGFHAFSHVSKQFRDLIDFVVLFDWGWSAPRFLRVFPRDWPASTATVERTVPDLSSRQMCFIFITTTVLYLKTFQPHYTNLRRLFWRREVVLPFNFLFQRSLSIAPSRFVSHHSGGYPFHSNHIK